MTTNDADSRLRGWVLLPGWVSAGLLLICYPLFPHWLDRHQFLPFLFGMVFLGLPHGAQDHLVVPRLRGERVTFRFLVVFMAGYGALVGLYLLFWVASPRAAFLVFLIFSLLHWGQGDAYALATFARTQTSRSRWGRALVWLVRGALPIALPVLAFPGVFAHVASGMARWYGGAGIALAGTVRTGGWAALAVCVALYLAQSRRANGSGKAFALDAGEVALLCLLFTRVPPVLAVGTYFCFWHGLRHFGRLILADPAARVDVQAGRIAAAFGRAARDAFPLTVVSLLLFVGLYAGLPRHALSAEGATFLYLSLVAALTFPHFLLVLWMDKQDAARVAAVSP